MPLIHFQSLVLIIVFWMFHINNSLFICGDLDQANRPVRVVAYDINKCFKFCLYLFRSQGYFESSGRSRFKFFLAAGQIDTLIITSDAVDRERSLSGIRNLKCTRYLPPINGTMFFLFGSLPIPVKCRIIPLLGLGLYPQRIVC